MAHMQYKNEKKSYLNMHMSYIKSYKAQKIILNHILSKIIFVFFLILTWFVSIKPAKDSMKVPLIMKNK